jgi:hypothetical protein
MAGYQYASGNADAALRLIPTRSVFNPRPYLTFTSASLGQIGVANSSLAHQKRIHCSRPRCAIENDIQKRFLTDDTNEPDEPDPTTQLGWFQVIKGYLPAIRYPSILVAYFSRFHPLLAILRTFSSVRLKMDANLFAPI